MDAIQSLKPGHFCFLEPNEQSPKSSEDFLCRIHSYDFFNLNSYDFQIEDLSRRIAFSYNFYHEEQLLLGSVFETLMTAYEPYGKSAKEQVLDIILKAIEQDNAYRFKIYDDYFLSSFENVKHKRFNLYTQDIDLRQPTPQYKIRTFLISSLNEHNYRGNLAKNISEKLSIILEDATNYLSYKKKWSFDCLEVVIENLSQSRNFCALENYYKFLSTIAHKWNDFYLQPSLDTKRYDMLDIDTLCRFIRATTHVSQPSLYRTVSHLNSVQTQKHNFYQYFYTQLLPSMGKAVIENKDLSHDPDAIEQDVWNKLTSVKTEEFAHIENGYLMPYLHAMCATLNITPQQLCDSILQINNNPHSLVDIKISTPQFQKIKTLLTFHSNEQKPKTYGDAQSNYLHILLSNFTTQAFAQAPELQNFFKNLISFIQTPPGIEMLSMRNAKGLTPIDVFELILKDTASLAYEGSFNSQIAQEFYQAQIVNLRAIEEKILLSRHVELETKNKKISVDKIHKL